MIENSHPAIVSLTFMEYICLLILIILLGVLCVFLLDMFSTSTSRLGVYHKKEKTRERIKKLYLTYMTLIAILVVFVIVSIVGLAQMLSDLLDVINIKNSFDILVIGLAVTCIFLLSVRIYTTTGLMNTNNVEKYMNLTPHDLRERTLSTLYSLLVSIVIFICFGILIIFLYVHNDPSSKVNELMSWNFYINFSFIKIFLCALTFPLIVATVGEYARYIVSKIYPMPEENN